MSELVQVAGNDGLLEIRLDRPDKKNALTAAMYEDMTAALQRAQSEGGIGVVLFTGAGDAFCAGNDLSDFMAGADGGKAAFAFIRALTAFEKPVVAAVQGLAVGIGTTMLFHCDLVYAAPDARFIMPFVNLGIVPEAGASLLAPGCLGHAKAAAMLLLGEPMDAQAADAAGLVTSIVPAAELADLARQKAVMLTAKPVQAVMATRRLMRPEPAVLLQRIDEEARLFGELLQGADAQEAFTAFFEKRKPNFAKRSSSGS